MSENSKIEWCDHTFNPWIGCTKVSPGCANCYAAVSTRARVLRAGGQETWGKGAQRSRTTSTWGDPVKWNREAAGSFQQVTMKDGTIYRGTIEKMAELELNMVDIHNAGPARPRVFCASLADWLDDEVPIDWLKDLLILIQQTPNLDWLLLTKRPENFTKRIQEVAEGWQSSCEIAVWWARGVAPENVWIGTTVENQEMADRRIPLLLGIPAKVRFLSCEPLLGFVDIQQVGDDDLTIYWPLHGKAISEGMNEPAALKHGGIHWVICGGESGSGARPMHPFWARSLRDQCQAAGVPFLFKQWGEWIGAEDGDELNMLGYNSIAHRFDDGSIAYRFGKKKTGRLLDGREWNEFPNRKEGA